MAIVTEITEETTTYNENGETITKSTETIIEDDGDDDYVDEDDIIEVTTEQVIATTENGLGESEDETDEDSDEELDDYNDSFDASKETIFERLSALVDIVPPTARALTYVKTVKTAKFIYNIGSIIGTTAWVLATASLLVGLPVGLELEREQFVLMQEAQARAVENSSKQTESA